MNTQKKKDYCFTTLDGVKIYVGDTFWAIAPTNTGQAVINPKRRVSSKTKITWNQRYWSQDAERFSTKKAAMEYLKRNP